MTKDELLQKLNEVKGLGKGLGAVGAKISKAAGGAGIDVSSNNKPLDPSKAQEPKGAQAQGGAPEDAEGAAEDPQAQPGEEPIDTSPEVVETLPEPEEMQFDRLGSPDKNHLIGHIVRWGSKEHILDWDDEYEVYKLVDPDTLRVKSRVKSDSISVVDYEKETVKEALDTAVGWITAGADPEKCIDILLDG